MPAVAGAWPRPIAGCGSAGRGAGLGAAAMGARTPSLLAILGLSPTVLTPLLLSSPVAALSWGTQPRVLGVLAASFHQDPLTQCRLDFSFKSYCPSGSGQPFRRLFQRDSWRPLDLSGVVLF